MKIFDKFPSKREKVQSILRHFESHCDLEVQKRACEYVKLLDAAWDHDRKTEVNVPVPPYKASASAFSSIPVGDTTL